MATIRRPMRGSASMADVEPDMNVTPLVDICLVLLIIFMVVTPRMNQDIPLDLPGIFNPDPSMKGSMDPLKLTIAKAGEYYVNKGDKEDATTLDDLEAYLKQLHETDPFRKIVLRADEKLNYGEARLVMARVQESGYPGLSFMVGQRYRPGESPAEVTATRQASAETTGEAGDASAAPAAAAPPANPGQGN
ncbi:MAG: biopolymer transporter ExbD [Candidatus Binatia bacterium]